MLYRVSIDPTLLGDVAPSDGFIDPSSIESYRARRVYVGTVANPTIVPNSSFTLCGVTITTTGTDLASLVNDINDKKFQHGVQASAGDTDELVLRLLPGFEQNVISVRDRTPGTAASFGFDNPTILAREAAPATLALTSAKERANVRWNLILEALQLSSNIKVTVTDVAGGSVEDELTLLEFVVEVPDNYYNYDFTGQTVYGRVAIQLAIAKTLMYNVSRNREYRDPTLDDQNRAADNVILPIEVGQLTDSMNDAISSVTVDIIPIY